MGRTVAKVITKHMYCTRMIACTMMLHVLFPTKEVVQHSGSIN